MSAHSCRRIVCLAHYKNLIYFSYWFIQSDRLLAKKDLKKVKPEHIYKVKEIFQLKFIFAILIKKNHSKFCFERGINANMIPLNELINYLELWLEFSSKVNDKPLISNFSLILIANEIYFINFFHCKIFR